MNEGKKVLVIQGLQLEKKYFSATMYWVIVVQCSSAQFACNVQPRVQRRTDRTEEN